MTRARDNANLGVQAGSGLDASDITTGVLPVGVTGGSGLTGPLQKTGGTMTGALVAPSVQTTSGPTISTYNNQNLKVRAAGSGTDTGISGYSGNDTWVYQLYGSAGTQYGFLDSNWGGWDLRKVPTGRLEFNNNSTYYIQPETTSNFNTVSANSFTGAGSAKHIGIFSPSAHNTAAAGWQDMDLSMHNNLVSGYTSYLTQSANILTIVKPGIYHIYVHTLTDTPSTTAEMDLYLYVTGYPDQTQRIQPAAGWSTMIASGTYQLSAGNTINARIQNSSPTTYHHHVGPTWTSMTVTYLGT